MSKAEKLMEALRTLGELYPHLEQIMIDNLDDPNYVIVCTKEHYKAMQVELGISEDLSEEMDHHYPTMKNNKKVH